MQRSRVVRRVVVSLRSRPTDRSSVTTTYKYTLSVDYDRPPIGHPRWTRLSTYLGGLLTDTTTAGGGSLVLVPPSNTRP